MNILNSFQLLLSTLPGFKMTQSQASYFNKGVTNRERGVRIKGGDILYLEDIFRLHRRIRVRMYVTK